MSAHNTAITVSKEHAELLNKATEEVINARIALTEKLVRLEDILAALGFNHSVTAPDDILPNAPT